MKRDQLTSVGSYLSRRVKCDSCQAFYGGLNYLRIEKIETKRDEFGATLERLAGELLKDKAGLDWINEAITDEHKLRGLGDVVYRLAKRVGIKQQRNCGCGKRRAALNRLIPFRSK